MIRNNVHLPYTDPTYMEVPPVGHYSQPRIKNQLNRIKSLKAPLQSKHSQSRIVIKGERSTQKGFNSTTKRDVAKLKSNLQTSPGPGSYDLTFKDIIKMMDQKLAIRYQISPFGSGKPRFNPKGSKINVTKSNSESLENKSGFVVKDKHAASDILNEHYKNKEKYRNSYTYASNVNRFRNTIANKLKADMNNKNIRPDFMLVDESKQNEASFNDISSHSAQIIDMKQNNMLPFDSHTPRFPNKRNSSLSRKL